MTTPNNSEVIVDDAAQVDTCRTFRTLQLLKAIASKFGSPEIFVTMTPVILRRQFLYTKYVYVDGRAIDGRPINGRVTR